MGVGYTEFGIDEVSVGRFAGEDVVKDLDADLDGEVLTSLNLRNWDLDSLKKELGLISVAGLKMESFRIGPLGCVLEGELHLNRITSPGSDDVSWLSDDDSASWVLSTLLFGFGKGLLSVLTHMLAKEVLHEPANLLLHHARVHTLGHHVGIRFLSMVGVDSSPGLLLIPLLLQLLIDFDLLVSLSGDILTNDGENSLRSLLGLVDLEESMGMLLGSFTVGTPVKVLVHGTFVSWTDDGADTTTITLNVLMDMGELRVIEVGSLGLLGLLFFLVNTSVNLWIFFVNLIQLRIRIGVGSSCG
jgi:hypothetical protein